MEDMITLLQSGESETVEFKKSTASLREGIESLCAFANHKGGRLLFGVDDDGKVLGQQVSDDTLKNIANAVKGNTDPKLFPQVGKITLEGKTCILLSIEESPLKPHLAYGRAFMRVGATNQKLDREQYEHLLLQHQNGYGFDWGVMPNVSLEDIDEEAVYRFIETANSVREFNANTLLPLDITLKNLELLTEKGITRAAILLFGKKPAKHFSFHYEVKCGSFISDEGYDEIVNDKEYAGNLIDNYNNTFAFILEAIKRYTAKQKDGKQRKEEWEFPLPVLREALVNMIVHRDYRLGVKCTVEVRPSFISFYNPGQLFPPLKTVDQLQTIHPSRPGNRLIAKVFYLMGLLENWGSGTLKIISETKKAGKPTPKFSYDGGMFLLKLPRK